MIKPLPESGATVVFCQLKDWDAKARLLADVKACGGRWIPQLKMWAVHPEDFHDEGFRKCGESSYDECDPLTLDDYALTRLAWQCTRRRG